MSRPARDARLCALDEAIGAQLATALAELGYATRRVDITQPPTVVAAALGDGAEPDALVIAAGPSELDAAREIVEALAGQGPEPGAPLLLALADGALTERALPGGIDELVVVPVSAEELGARISLAWSRLVASPDGDTLSVAGIALDPATYRATVDGRRVDLTHIEFRLLRFLLSHPNRVYTREALLERVWGYEHYAATRTVDVHVRRLRSKLGDHHGAAIETVRSVGYRLER